MPPLDYRIITKDDLLRKFVEEGWPEKLSQYDEDPPRTFGGHKTMRVWRTPHGDVKCRKLEYMNPIGRSEVIRQLLDDDGIEWYIP